jgi:DHA1 family bicyclomycin/chloramphenicol resistance-like MFS transporter
MIPPLLVSIAEEFEVSVAVAGQLATATFAAWAVSVVLCGPLSDSLGRRPIALTGLALMTGATAAAAFAPNLEVLLALRVITGLGGGMIPPNGVAAVSEVISREKRAQAVGGLLAVNVLTAAISVPLLALLADWAGWRYAFVASGMVLGTALVLNFIWFPADSGERIRNFSFLSRYRSLLSMGFFRAAIFVVATHRIAYWGMVSYLPVFLIQNHGLSVGAVAAPLAIAAAGQVVGSYSVGYLASRVNRTALIAVASAVGGLCGLVFFSIPVDLWVAVAVAAIGTGLLCIPFPTLAAASTEFSGQSRATGIGLLGLGNQSGGVGGAAFAGLLLASVGFEGVGYLCLGVTVVSALVAGLLMRRPPENVS